MRVKFLDILSIIAVLILAFVCALSVFFANTGTHLIVCANGKNYALTLDDDTTHEITSAGYKLTLKIEDGEAFIAEHTCPDGVCSAMGKISRNGECIVCIPAKVTVRVSGENEVLDGIAG